MIRILEMARSIKDIRSDLRSRSDEYLIHLMKIYCYKDSLNCIDHWIKEIYSFYNKIAKVKGSNKFPKIQDIYESIYGGIEDVFPEWIDNMIVDLERDYDKKVISNNHEELIKFIADYSLWISEQLSSNGQVTFNDVMSKIKELL